MRERLIVYGVLGKNIAVGSSPAGGLPAESYNQADLFQGISLEKIHPPTATRQGLVSSMAKQLLLMRHAKSDWPEGIDSDFARPLNARGRKAAPKMGGWIRDQGHLPDLILCSSSQRTEETVQRMVQDWSPTPPVYSSRSLYLATAEGILDVVRSDAMDAERVLVVGHNPGMENLAHHLGVHSSGFPTAALAVFQVAIDSWSELQSGSDAECIEFVRPKALLASDESDNP